MAEAIEYQDEEREDAREGWRIEDLADADWGLRRLGQLKAEIAENLRMEEAAVLRIRLRTEALNRQAQRGVDFFTAKLREFAETHRAELLKGSRKKSRALLSGVIGWRKKPADLEVVDAAALLAWARAQPVELELVRIKEEPALGNIKAHFRAQGEVPDGCEPKAESEELVIKTMEEMSDVREH